MIRRAFLAAAIFAAFGSSAYAATADDLELWFDIDRTVYLRNMTGADIQFDGYQITSESDLLDVAGWYSISDRVAAGEVTQLIAELGVGALGFGELSPTPSQVAEANLTGTGVLKAGEKFSLGKPFSPTLPLQEICQDIGFYFKIAGMPEQFQAKLPTICMPEPSAWLLASTAGGGLAVVRVRRRGCPQSAGRPSREALISHSRLESNTGLKGLQR